MAHPRSADLFLADLADEIDEHPQRWSAVANGLHTYWPVEDDRFRRRFTTGQPPPHLDRANTALRPPWPAELHPLPGSRIAEIVIADSPWPSLAATVAASDWPPRDLLAAAAEHVRGIAETEQLRTDEYARLLTPRAELPPRTDCHLSRWMGCR